MFVLQLFWTRRLHFCQPRLKKIAEKWKKTLNVRKTQRTSKILSKKKSSPHNVPINRYKAVLPNLPRIFPARPELFQSLAEIDQKKSFYSKTNPSPQNVPLDTKNAVSTTLPKNFFQKALKTMRSNSKSSKKLKNVSKHCLSSNCSGHLECTFAKPV